MGILFVNLTKYINVKRKTRSAKGQGITEYATVLAFTAFLITLAFAFAPGKLAPAVSAAYSCAVDQLNNMSAYATGAS